MPGIPRALAIGFLLVVSGLLSGLPGFRHVAAADPTRITIEGQDLIAADLSNVTRKPGSVVTTMWLDQPNEWENATDRQSPTARYGSSMSWEPSSGLAVLTGGRDTNFVLLNETWSFNLSARKWNLIVGPVAPDARFHGAMAFDSAVGASIMFGGWRSGSRLNDTWIFWPQSSSWVNATSPVSPSARQGHAMTFVPELGGVLVFGGQGSSALLNDTWLFNATRREWTEISAPGAPSARTGHRMTYSDSIGRVLLFGGMTVSPLSDTWFFDPAAMSWSLVTSSPTPGNRYGHVLVTNTTTGEVVLFGGTDDLLRLNDTWLFNSSTLRWRQVFPSISPPGVYFASGYFDARLQCVVVFGGIDQFLGTNRTNVWGAHRPLGRLESRAVDLASLQPGLVPLRILWTPQTQPSPTLLRAQVASSDIAAATNFVGPDGTSSTYFEGSGETLWSGHAGDRFLRVRVDFSTDWTPVSPELISITIEAASSPTVTLSSPDPGQWVNATPELGWTVQDPDAGDEQSMFEVQVSSEPGFSTVTLTSGNVDSNQTAWTIPDPGLDEGTWYWRARTADSFSLWSLWSEARTFGIDTTPPEIALRSVETLPSDGRYVVVVRWTVADSASGVASLDVWLDGDPVVGAALTGVTLSDVAPGAHRISISATDRVGNSGNLNETFQLEEPSDVVGVVLALIVAGGAGAVGVLVLLKRRRDTKSKPQEPDDG